VPFSNSEECIASVSYGLDSYITMEMKVFKK
jgi:hypothetical protein